MNATSHPGRAYQWVLVGLLSLNFGVVFFDRNSIGYLMPFIQPQLGLSNTQVGELGSALSLSWALAGLFVGRLSDALGKRKAILVACAFVFSAASLLSGLASSFLLLMAARLMMGIAEGGVMPISQTLVAAEVEPQRRGLAMGAAQNFGANLLGNTLCPLVLTWFAMSYGWRNAFNLSAAPGFVLALLMLWLIRDPPIQPGAKAQPRTSLRAILSTLGQRNIWICVVLSILLVAFLVVLLIFMPTYLVKVRGLNGSTESWLISMWGLPSMLYAFLIPGSSDFLGRRPIVIAMGAASALIPLSVLIIDPAAPVWPLFVMFALGATVSGIYPLVMATIPSETVSASQMATVLALTMGLGEAIGGVLSPTLAGEAMDAFGQGALLWILLGISGAMLVFSCALKETAPTVLHRRSLALSTP
jgi:MFS transporter, ACS family, hexuronate transporter